MNNSIIFLEGQAPGGMGGMNIIFIVAMVAIFYFFMIRPQNKKRKQLQEMRSNIKKGDVDISFQSVPDSL